MVIHTAAQQREMMREVYRADFSGECRGGRRVFRGEIGDT